MRTLYNLRGRWHLLVEEQSCLQGFFFSVRKRIASCPCLGFVPIVWLVMFVYTSSIGYSHIKLKRDNLFLDSWLFFLFDVHDVICFLIVDWALNNNYLSIYLVCFYCQCCQGLSSRMTKHCGRFIYLSGTACFCWNAVFLGGLEARLLLWSVVILADFRFLCFRHFWVTVL